MIKMNHTITLHQITTSLATSDDKGHSFKCSALTSTSPVYRITISVPSWFSGFIPSPFKYFIIGSAAVSSISYFPPSITYTWLLFSWGSRYYWPVWMCPSGTNRSWQEFAQLWPTCLSFIRAPLWVPTARHTPILPIMIQVRLLVSCTAKCVSDSWWSWYDWGVMFMSLSISHSCMLSQNTILLLVLRRGINTYTSFIQTNAFNIQL